MLPEYFALIGAAIASSGGFYYLYCTIKGTVKPNRVTWFFWGTFPMIAFAAQFSQEVGMLAWATFIAGFTPFLIIIASYLNPDAYWRIAKLDYIFAAIGVFSIALWWVTKEANVALAFALIADLAVALPTIFKAYRFPETESWVAYALSAVGFGIACLSINIWTFENYAFILYLFFTNLLVAALAVRKSSVVTTIPSIE